MFKDRKKLSLQLSALLLAGGLSVSSQAVLIEVTTVQDHFGEDDTTCSLREAVEASVSKAAFGGCVAGQKNITDIIRLKDDTVYQLTREIEVTRKVDRFFTQLRIVGSESVNSSERDTITGAINKRLLPTPTIRAASGKRVFNTSADGLGLSLTNVNIEGSGVAGIKYGGVFLVGGRLTLNNVTVKNGYADNGGAIFLEGANSSVNMSRTVFENNKAAVGAVLSEFCFDNLSFDRRRIEIQNSSIVGNSTLTSVSQSSRPSIIKTCGAPIISIEHSTLAENNSGNNGALIDFHDVNRFDTGNKTNTPKLSIDFSTLAGNQNGIYFSELGELKMTNSVVAFNASYDCEYKQSAEANQKGQTFNLNDVKRISVSQNLFSGTNTRGDTESDCDLPELTNSQKDLKNDYVGNQPLTDFFESQGVADYGLGLKGYLPKLNTADNKLSSLLLSERSTSCSGSDMRGMPRATFDNSIDSRSDGCYKGAIERGRLLAIFDSSAKNVSYVDYINRFQAQIDIEPSPDLSEDELKNFNEITRQNKALLQAYKDAYDKSKNTNIANFSGFRQVFVSALDNDIPFEKRDGSIKLFPFLKGVNPDGSYEVLSKDNYIVSVDIDKSGNGSADGDDIKVTNLSAPVYCRWDSNLQQIVIWRKNSTTPSGSLDYCFYTVTYTDKQTGESQSSSAYATANIVNIAPIAENLVIETVGNEERVVIDLSGSISDGGDGASRPVNTNGTLALPTFYETAEGVSRFIEIVKPPELGRLIFSGESGDCPNPNANQVNTSTCYGGDITYVRDNVASQFDDSFTYKVYDGGEYVTGGLAGTQGGTIVGSLPSNTATVEIKADRRTGPASSIISGGGSIGWFALFMLLIVRIVSGQYKRSRVVKAS